MNKQKTDWEKEWNKLTVKSYNLKTEKYEDEPIIFVNDKSWKKVKDFISNLLQQQREEIIKEIEGIVGEGENYTKNIEPKLTMDSLRNIEMIVEIQARNKLRQEIRERLKQIIN